MNFNLFSLNSRAASTAPGNNYDDIIEKLSQQVKDASQLAKDANQEAKGANQEAKGANQQAKDANQLAKDAKDASDGLDSRVTELENQI